MTTTDGRRLRRDRNREAVVQALLELHRSGDLNPSTEAWLAELDPGTLTNVMIPRPLPPVVANTYSARVAGEDGITRLDGIECWVYQHGLRHMGEIEHARALVGLEGMTS